MREKNSHVADTKGDSEGSSIPRGALEHVLSRVDENHA